MKQMALNLNCEFDISFACGIDVLFLLLESKFGVKFAFIFMDIIIVLIAALLCIPDNKAILLYIIPVVFFFNICVLLNHKGK